MLKKELCILMLCLTISSFAQITNEGVPRSWNMAQIKSEIRAIKLPVLDMQKIKAEDVTNDKIKAKPFRFGFKHEVDYGLKNAGYWNELPNGDRIWRVLFESKGALSMNFIFDMFFMPEGGKVYLYSDDRNDLLGAYTNVQNQKNENLGTWIVKGDKIWIEDNGIRIQDDSIVASPRVGIDYAEDHASLPWRFYLNTSKFVSKR